MRALPTLLTAGLATVLSALLGLVVLPAASGAEAWAIPGKATITVRGHGYGHGHGMSQYGAEGAARQGLTYRKIVEFYYPGTTWGTSKGKVRVLISADTTPDLVVLPRPGLTVRDLAGGPAMELPDNGATRWRVLTGADGVTRVGYLTKRWHAWKVLEGLGQFAAGGQPVTLVTPSGQTAYRGKLRLADTSSGSRVTVNVLTLDNYLRGVVPLEIPALWSAAAVRAQAVAARTYAAYERSHPRSSAYQICDTSSCQVYGGYDAEHPASNQAIDATRRRVLTSGGAPAFTQFASSSGGWTSAGGMPYLPAQRDPYDDWAGNPVHDWSTKLDAATIRRTWPSIGALTRITVSARDGNGAWGGRVSSVTLVGKAGRVTVSGDAFRSALALRSTWFTFKIKKG